MRAARPANALSSIITCIRPGIRAKQLGLDEPYPGAEAAVSWLDEQANMRKEKNFFETRVTEYQTGGALKWD